MRILDGQKSNPIVNEIEGSDGVVSGSIEDVVAEYGVAQGVG